MSAAGNVVWLIRHGHEDRATGALTAKGHRRVAALARLLRPHGPCWIRASPIRRSVETAELLTRELGLGPRTLEPALDPAQYSRAGWPWSSQWLTKGGGQPMLVAGLGIANILGRTSRLPERSLLAEVKRWRRDHSYNYAILVTHGELIRAVVHLLSINELSSWVRRGPWLIKVPKAAAVELGPVGCGWGFRSLKRPLLKSAATDR